VAASSGDGLDRRIAYVDGLRAIAVLAVVASHAAKWASSLHEGVLANAWSDGAPGVDLFFVLSGFCLSYPFLRAARARGAATFNIGGYFARRVVRIIPPYYLAILVLGLGLAWAAHAGLFVSFGVGASPPTWLDVIKQALFLDRQVTYVNTSFWTLAIEWRWYFLFPLCLWLWTRSSRAFVALVAACAVGAAWTHASGWDLLALPAFLLGIIAADIELAQRPIGRVALLMLALSLCIAVVLDPAYVLGYALQQPIGWQLASFFLVVSAGSVPLLRSTLSLRPLVWVGIASYSIYLVHEPIIELFARNTGLGAVLAGCLSIACGAVFWLVFERWFVTQPMKGRLIGWLQPRIASLLEVLRIPQTFVIQRAPSVDELPAPGPADASTAELVAGAR
jgi:peptidoglycan/LPS O-acetylase OafA/YrhL